MAFRFSFQDLEDRFDRLRRRPIRRIDLIHERDPIRGLLGDEVHRLRLHVLSDLFAGPPTGFEAFLKDGWTAPQDDGDVDVHQMAVAGLQDRDLRRDEEAVPQGVDINLVGSPRLVSADDEALLPGDGVQVDHNVSAAGEDFTGGGLAGAGRARDRDEHRNATRPSCIKRSGTHPSLDRTSEPRPERTAPTAVDPRGGEEPRLASWDPRPGRGP